MKRSLLLILILIAAGFCKLFAQTFDNKIYGIVKDIATGKPLTDVNIFISHFTWGTTSDQNGNFNLSSIRPGKHELVFSIIGYATQSKSVTVTKDSVLFSEIKLIPKVYELKEVTVVEEKPDEWYDDLDKFIEKFFGYTRNPHNCIVVNQNYLEFNHPEENILVARCEYPLEILNYSLGYRIMCEIQEFEYDSWSAELKQNYRLYYSELDTSDTAVKNEWIKNRRLSYQKSLYFFFKKLISDSYTKENFSITLVTKPRIIRQTRLIEINSSTEILTKNKITETYQLSFSNYLQVEYDDYYRNPKISWLKLNYPFITIDKYGYPLEDYAITLLGYCAKSGIASSLPKDYDIPE